MPVDQCMKTEVVSIPVTATVLDAAKYMAWHQVGTLPVVDSRGVLVGMLSIADVLQAFLPDFVALIDDIEFLVHLGDLHPAAPDPARLDAPVRTIMHEPVAAELGTGLMLAAALLQRQSVNDICVVDAQGRLVGIASRTDVGAALIAEWITAHAPTGAARR